MAINPLDTFQVVASGANRSLASRFLDTLNTNDYLGPTYNTTKKALNKAIADATLAGGFRRIYIPGGTHDLEDGAIDPITKANITIEGDGPATQLVISSASASGQVFSLQAKNLVLRQMQIIFSGPSVLTKHVLELLGCTNCLIEQLIVSDCFGLAVMGPGAADEAAVSRVTLRDTVGSYNASLGGDLILVNHGTNIRLEEGKFNSSSAAPQNQSVLPRNSPAMIKLQSLKNIDTYSIHNWGCQVVVGSTGLNGDEITEADDPTLGGGAYGLIIDCTKGTVVNGTTSGTVVFDHVLNAGVLIASEATVDNTLDDAFGGLIASGIRSNADAGSSRVVDWQGRGDFRGYIELGGRLQALSKDVPMIKVGYTAAARSFQPPRFIGCSMRGTVPNGGPNLTAIFETNAPLALSDCTIENQGNTRIAKLGRVTASVPIQVTGCFVRDTIDPSISFAGGRHPDTQVYGNIGVLDNTIADQAALAGLYNPTTAAWLRSGDPSPAAVPARAKKLIYDDLLQGMWDAGLGSSVGLLGLFATASNQALAQHDVFTPSRRFDKVSAPTWAGNRGYGNGGGGGFLDTGYVLGQDGIATSSSLTLIVGCSTNIQSANADLTASGVVSLNARTTSDTLTARAGTSATLSQALGSSPTSIGISAITRNGSAVRLFRNGIFQQAASDPAPSSLPTNTVKLCETSSSSGRRVSLVYISSGRTDAELATLQGLFSACLTALGVPV